MEKFKVYKDNTLLGEFTKEEIELAKTNGASFTEDIDGGANIIYLLTAGEIFIPGSQLAQQTPDSSKATESEPSAKKKFTCYVTLKKYVIVEAEDKRAAFAEVRKHDLGQYLEARDVRIEN
ncbi:MAG: hypothetical protein IT280_13115 [Ignavibacteria bacterium]|nr:hypothetical protein [Ignavibacteria bacterium]